MLELTALVWLLAFIFAYIGWQRGWTKEIISLSGITLGLFALYQFDALIRETLFGQLPRDQVFYLQSILFLLIVFFAYQTRALEDSRGRRGEGRAEVQSRSLGAIVGFVNGFLIGGTLWYFLDINRLADGSYPLSPYIIAPPAGSASAEAVNFLPLYVLTQGGNGDLLSLMVVILFVIVLILI